VLGGTCGSVLAGAIDGRFAEGLLLFDVVGEVTKCLIITLLDNIRGTIHPSRNIPIRPPAALASTAAPVYIALVGSPWWVLLLSLGICD